VKEGVNATPPFHCNVPPDTPYAVLVKKTLDRTQTITHKTRMTLSEWKHRVQEETCADLPAECDEDGEQHRSLKQKVLCRHVPSPCDDEDDDDDEKEEMSVFVSPLDKVNASRIAAEKVESVPEEVNVDVNGEAEVNTDSSDDNVEMSSGNEENAEAVVEEGATL